MPTTYITTCTIGTSIHPIVIRSLLSPSGSTTHATMLCMYLHPEASTKAPLQRHEGAVTLEDR